MVQTARELHESLCAPDPITRLRVLKAVAAQPKLSLDFGLHEGRDVIAVLLERAEILGSGNERNAVLATLCAFRDTRVTALLIDILGTATDPQSVLFAAHGLREEPIHSLYPHVSPLLLQNESEARSRAAAGLLMRAKSPGMEVAIRLALLADDDVPVTPPVDQINVSAWLNELQGPFAHIARIEIELLGKPAFTILGTEFEQLDSDTRVWLIQWGAAEFTDAVLPLLPKALQTESESVALAILDVIAHMRVNGTITPGMQSELARSVALFICHSTPSLRRAAIDAYPVNNRTAENIDLEPPDWRTQLANEPETEVRRAALRRLVEDDVAAALDDVLELMADPDWSMRAEAVSAIIAIGEPAKGRVEALVEDERETVRVAAAKALLTMSAIDGGL